MGGGAAIVAGHLDDLAAGLAQQLLGGADEQATDSLALCVLGDDEAVSSTMQALNEARPYIRHAVGERTDLRFVPEIEFVSDTSAARAARISKLLREASQVEGDR